MMKARRFAIATLSVVSALLAISAQAETVAGWDFSQYFTDGIPSIDGSNITSALDANYSSLDPTGNAGAESAAFGTMNLTGTILPTAGSLESNRKAPADEVAMNSFDAHGVLQFEGQLFQELMAMTAVGSGSLVFETDLTPASQTGTGWSVSFAGKTFDESSCTPDCTSMVSVEFSEDGSGYTSFGSVMLDSTDTAFEVALANVTSSTGFVRLGLDSTNGQPIIDNVAVKVTQLPEPGATVALLAGSLFLAAVRRRRG